MGTLLHSCVEVLEPIELSSGVVRGVGLGIGILDGVDVLQGEEAVSIGFSGFQWRIFTQKCIRLLHEKLTVFPYAQYMIRIYVSLAFQRYSQVRGRC